MPVNETIERIIYEGVDRISAASKSAERSNMALRESIDGVKNALGVLGITVSAGAMVALYKDALNATAALDDMAESTGASVEGLSAIQRVARVGGHDFEGLTGQISRMVKGLREGSEEGSRTARAFEFLDLKARDASGQFRSTDEILVELARKLETVTTRADRNLLVQDALGKGAERYIPLLKEIAEGTDLVATRTTAQAAAAEEAEKNQRRLIVALSDTRHELVNQTLPAVNRYVLELLAAKQATSGWYEALGAFFSLSGRQGADPLAAIGELDRKLAALRETQRALAADTLGARFNRMMAPEDLVIVQKQIEDAERQRRVLLAIMSRTTFRNTEGMVEDAAGIHVPPATPRRRYGGDDPDDAKAQREREFVARQLQEGLEEEQRIQAEAWGWTAFYAGRKLDTERATAEAILQQKSDYYDREQELAIERGQEILEADPLSYSMRVEMLRQTLLSEEELAAEAHGKRLETLRAYGLDVESAELEHAARLYQIRQRSLHDVSALLKQGYRGQAAVVLGTMAEITAGAAQHSRALFEVNKIAAIATIALKAPEAIASSFAFGAKIGGPPLGAAMAGIAAAAMAVQAAAVASAKYGGGAAPSIAGSTPAPPVTPVPAEPAAAVAPQIHITFSGSGRYSEEEIRGLIESINDALRKGMRIAA